MCGLFALTHQLLVRSLGTTPISGKMLSECKGHSRSPGRVPGYSRSSSRSSENNSRSEKFILGMASHDLSSARTHNSRSNSRSNSWNCCEPTRKISFAPAFSERFFKNWGGPRAPELGLPKKSPNGALLLKSSKSCPQKHWRHAIGGETAALSGTRHRCSLRAELKVTGLR